VPSLRIIWSSRVGTCNEPEDRRANFKIISISARSSVLKLSNITLALRESIRLASIGAIDPKSGPFSSNRTNRLNVTNGPRPPASGVFRGSTPTQLTLPSIPCARGQLLIPPTPITASKSRRLTLPMQSSIPNVHARQGHPCGSVCKRVCVSFSFWRLAHL
jgi:hypothetical protein